MYALLLAAALVAPTQELEGEAVYAKLVAKLKPVKSLSGKVTVVWGADQQPETFTFKAMKPNFLRQESPEQGYYIDGKHDWAYMVKDKLYNKAEAEPDRIGGVWLIGFEPFMGGPQPEYKFLRPHEQTYDKREAIVLRVSEKEGDGTEYLIFVDRETNLPLGWEMRFQSGETASGKYADVVLDAEMKPEDFAWAPPPGAKPMDGRSQSAGTR